MPHAELYAKKGEAEILILGNSRGYRSFNENLFTKKTKNYSLIGSSTLINEIIISDYLDIYNNPPKIIILEVTNVLSENEAIKEFRVFGYKSKRVANLLKKKYPKIFYWGKLTNLFQFNNKTFLNGIQKIFIPYEYKPLQGFINNVNPNKIEKNTFNKSNDLINDNIQSLNKIINLCDEKNIDLYLVIAPFYPKRLKVEDNEFRLWLEKTKISINGFPITDFSKNIKNEKYFFDWKHINEDGIKIFHQLFVNHEVTKEIFY